MSTTTTTGSAVERYQPVMSEPEQTTLLGFLAGYRGYTRDAYTLDLRQFTSWCATSTPAVRGSPRRHRMLRPRARGPRQGAGDGRSSAVHDRRVLPLRRRRRRHRPLTGGARPPTPDSTTSPTSPDWTATRSARCSSPPDCRRRAITRLVSLLALNGLRVSEAIGADIEALGLERGHRTLTVLRKGGKVVTMPLAPRVARAVDLAVGERVEGPIFLGADGDRLDRHAAGRIVRRVARRAGIAKRVGPHTLRHAFITAALDAGVPLRDVQEAASHADPRTTMRYDRGRAIARPPRHLHRRHVHRRHRRADQTAVRCVNHGAPTSAKATPSPTAHKPTTADRPRVRHRQLPSRATLRNGQYVRGRRVVARCRSRDAFVVAASDRRRICLYPNRRTRKSVRRPRSPRPDDLYGASTAHTSTELPLRL